MSSKRKLIEKNESAKEAFIPIKPENIKLMTEVPVKEIREEDLITIEKPGKISMRKKPGKTKRAKQVKIGLRTRNISEDTEDIQEKKLEKDYTLIITEKPQAALKIANALGKARKYSENFVPYYYLERDGKKIIVACAVGHLLNLSGIGKGYPIFETEWLANFKSKKQDWSKKYYNLLVKLCKNASEFVIATDYDIEGEVIGWNIIRFIAKQKDAKRMKYSTLTTNELNEAYNNLMPTLDWSQAYAGETRHILDWLYGINLSRALMESIKKAGSFRIMSIGRVQGPALKFIVEKELEIQKFKSSLYWQVFIKLKNHKPELKYEKDIIKKEELKDFENLEGKKGMAKTEKSKRNISPPTPFDLTSLQREAYRLFKINPAKTLQLAQSLYLAGLISYPRTSSQKIPDSIKPKEILKKLAKNFSIVEYAIRDKPVEGKKSDPAHPSIFPTGEFEEMNADESKIYSIITKRFISCFCEDAEIESKKITFLCENKRFIASGIQIIKKGWMKVYPLAMQETDIEDIEGEKIIEKKKIEEKTTSPPRRYSPASIITELEKRNIGTKSTRSAIIETLYNRKYIENESIQATPLGISLISTLKKHSPIIIDEKLTRNFEKEMSEIQKAKKELKEKQEKILKDAKKSITDIANDFKKKEEKIGHELVKANKENYERERENNTLILCDKCKKGKLRILFNRKSFRYFVACNNYPECKNTYSLPPNALIKPAGKTCECGFPKLLAIRKAKRPWEFCFNEKNHQNKFFSGEENSNKK